MEDINNYKGLFYYKNYKQKFYEGGAHFKYFDLVNKLQYLLDNNGEKINNQNENIHNSMEEKNILENGLALKKKLITSRNIKLLNYNNQSTNQFLISMKKNIKSKSKSKLKLSCFLDKNLSKLKLKKRIESEDNIQLPKIKIHEKKKIISLKHNQLFNKPRINLLIKPNIENSEFFQDKRNLSQSNKTIYDEFSNNLSKNIQLKQQQLLLNISPHSNLFNGSYINSSIDRLNRNAKIIKLPKRNKIIEI